jgi:2-dehydro-3-deoxyphosphogluconate aldolase/(4S)-4-hydroxy-2-oxoglutarate aldolase
MPIRSRHALTARILSTKLMPNFATSHDEISRGVARAVLAGGCDVLEFLNRGDGAAACFARLAEWARKEAPALLLGAGTITEPGSAAQFINAGALFIVGPNFHPGVADVCNRAGIPYVPGCGTATEVSNAMAAGSDIIKFFPAPFLGGPAAVKALRGPFPQVLFMPSGGVETDLASLQAWFGAGVAAVSVGGALVSEKIVLERDWNTLEDETHRVMALIGEITR